MKTDDFMSLITKEEPLCEELQQWVQELSNGMKMVNHPLVQDMIFNEACCALFNERLKFKTAEVKKAYAEDNWHRYVFLAQILQAGHGSMDGFRKHLAALRRLG
jgi:hypothetical protein